MVPCVQFFKKLFPFFLMCLLYSTHIDNSLIVLPEAFSSSIVCSSKLHLHTGNQIRLFLSFLLEVSNIVAWIAICDLFIAICDLFMHCIAFLLFFVCLKRSLQWIVIISFMDKIDLTLKSNMLIF